MRKLGLLAISLIALVAVGCSAAPATTNGISGSVQPQGAVEDEALEAAPEVVEAAPEADVEAQAAPAEVEAAEEAASIPFRASACPTPDADTLLYASPDNGFCFLYPAEYAPAAYMERPEDGVTIAESGGAFSFVSLSVTYNGPADMGDSEEYYEEWNAQLNTVENEPLSIPEVNKSQLNDYEAVVAYGLPAGMGQSRRAFLVEGESRYSIYLTPDTAPGFEDPAVDALWETVTESVVLFGAAPDKDYIYPEDVCPEEEPNTNLLINEAEGYCFLYPFDYQTTELFAGGVEGGPVLDRQDNIGEIRNRIVVSLAGPAAGNTAEDIMEPRMQVIDEATIEDMEMVEYDGLRFIDERGPYQSRQAVIVANGFQYTIVQQPYDTVAFPEATGEFEELWGTVTGSIAFFDPFR